MSGHIYPIGHRLTASMDRCVCDEYIQQTKCTPLCKCIHASRKQTIILRFQKQLRARCLYRRLAVCGLITILLRWPEGGEHFKHVSDNDQQPASLCNNWQVLALCGWSNNHPIGLSPLHVSRTRPCQLTGSKILLS